jgi:hypothetical protein
MSKILCVGRARVSGQRVEVVVGHGHGCLSNTNKVEVLYPKEDTEWGEIIDYGFRPFFGVGIPCYPKRQPRHDQSGFPI